MRSLVWRYVAAMHRKFENNPVTEDDINEVKSDISTMRYEMLDIFENSGLDVSSANKKEKRKQCDSFSAPFSNLLYSFSLQIIVHVA